MGEDDIVRISISTPSKGSSEDIGTTMSLKASSENMAEKCAQLESDDNEMDYERDTEQKPNDLKSSYIGYGFTEVCYNYLRKNPLIYLFRFIFGCQPR